MVGWLFGGFCKWHTNGYDWFVRCTWSVLSSVNRLQARHADSVNGIYIDGHSDSQGRRLMNRDMSKRRAEEVTAYLISIGLDPNMITTRYHGERYPVVPNNSKKNRDRNRRVTIRLEKE